MCCCLILFFSALVDRHVALYPMRKSIVARNWCIRQCCGIATTTFSTFEVDESDREAVVCRITRLAAVLLLVLSLLWRCNDSVAADARRHFCCSLREDTNPPDDDATGSCDFRCYCRIFIVIL